MLFAIAMGQIINDLELDIVSAVLQDKSVVAHWQRTWKWFSSNRKDHHYHLHLNRGKDQKLMGKVL